MNSVKLSNKTFSPRRPGIAGLAVFGLIAIVAVAAPRKKYTEAEIVSRAELIVVGALKKDSLNFVSHVDKGSAPAELANPNARSPSWEHHLLLTVSEVLKGQLSSTSLVVSVQYGLDPVVGGCFSNQFMVFVITTPGYPAEMVQIFDTGNSVRPPRAISGDIRTNHIWLLRHDLSRNNAESNRTPDMLTVYDPEDVQPVAWRDELIRLLKQKK